MILTLEELYKGKPILIKDNLYKGAEDYVAPFIERMSKYTTDFRIQAKLPQTLSVDPNGTDTWYTRVWVQAVLPSEHCYQYHDEVMGMIYALDVRKPIVKIYRGQLNKACTNLCIFAHNFLEIRDIEPEKPINFKCVSELMERTSDINVKLEQLANTAVEYEPRKIEENLGFWVRNAIKCSYGSGVNKVKISPSTVIDAYKSLYEDDKSPYYVKPGMMTDMFNVYNAFTDCITNDGNKENVHEAKDIVTKPEKILLLNDILAL